MSVHLTVNNPICIRRERTIFADREQIKKQERERRKRLRIEQVRQQAKDISSNVLERTKVEVRKKLNQLEKSENSELKRMHDRKIMEIQQKYQEDMEDIGLAHDAALAQPNSDAISEARKHEDRVAAAERGKEAIQRLKKASKPNSADIKRDRLRQVREVENIRSAMVSNIPKQLESLSKKSQQNNYTNASSSAQATYTHALQNDNDDPDTIRTYISPKKRKQKKLIGRKSPKKISLKTNGKVISHSPKSPQRVVVEIHREDVSSPKCNENQLNKQFELNVDANQDDIQYVICSSDNQLTSHLETEKNEKLKGQDGQHLEYNPNDYRQQTSGGSTSSSSSSGSSSSSLLSDDSSYFSDVAVVATVPNNTPVNIFKTLTAKSPTSKNGVNRGVQQKKNHPKGLVQRIDIKDELNAEDRARLIAEQELVEKNLSNENKLSAIQEKRGAQALARERTRRNYATLLKNLDNLTRDERQLKALNIQDSKARQREYANKLRRKEFHDHRQKLMNDAYDAALYGDNETLKEQVITLPRHRIEPNILKGQGQWEKSFHQDDDDHIYEDNPLSRSEQILEMLKKVERQKQLLLKEYGDTLPNEILRSSMTPLFSENKREKADSTCCKSSETEHRASPEIKVINVSRDCTFGDKKGKLKKKDTEKKKKIIAGLSEKNEIAIQTSQLNQVGGQNKSVQVELPDRVKRIMIPRKSKDSDKLEYVEPIVTIIAHGEVSSNESFGRGIVINVGNGTIQERQISQQQEQYSLGPSRKTSPRAKARSLPSSSPVKGVSTNTVTSTSAPTSRAGSPVKIQDSTDSTESQVVSEKILKKLLKRSPRKNKKKSPESSIYKTLNRLNKHISMEYSPNVQEQSTSSSRKPYAVKQQISYTDNSEASSSYASLSAVKSSSDTRTNNITSILQLLDSSISDSVRRLANEVTPVSTPETPSSHIINVPSNVPHYNRITRILSYSADDDKLGKKEKRTTFIKHEEKQRHQSLDQQQNSTTDSPQQSSSNGIGCIEPCCFCKNSSSYHTINENVGEIIRRRNNISKQESLVINKLDDLQIECEEKINTLATMLNRVRRDQDMEQSILTQTTETSIKKISPSKQQESYLTYYKKLQENVDTIHNHLFKTCTEYQKIDKDLKPSPNLSPIVETHDESRQNLNKIEFYESSSKTKPRILKEERVNIDLRRFKKQQDFQVLSPSTHPSKDDYMVEKLSNEILEQSKKWKKYKTLEDISFGDETIHCELPGTSTGISPKIVTSSPIAVEERTNDVEIIKTIPIFNHRGANEENFKRILDDIPKVTQDNRLKNRVEGRRPELSTIEELDTPDTATRSIASVRSPSVKSQRVYVDDILTKHMVSSNSIINIQSNNIPILSNIGEAPIKEQKNERAVEKELTISEFDRLNNVPILGENYKADYHEIDKQLVVSLPKNFYGINGEQHLKVDESLDSFLIHCSARNVEIKSDKITSSSSFSGFSGISDISSTLTSDTITSPPEKMEDYLMGLGLAWLIPIARKTREASALSSSSNSDITIAAMAKQTKSPLKKLVVHNPTSALPGFSDVSSISIREASKSTEKTVLMKGRTSTPNISNFHYTSEKSSVITTSTSGGMSFPDRSDSIIATNLSLYLKT